MSRFEINWSDLGPSMIGLLIIALITIVIELPIVLFGFRKSEYKHKFLLMAMLNIFTNVILNAFITYFYFDLGFDVLIMELVVVLVEAVVYYLAIYDITRIRAFVVSLLANIASFFLGTLIIEFSGIYDMLIETTGHWIY